MDREEALKLVHEKIGNKNLIKHCLAVETSMKALASHFGKDEEKWGLCGLVHDIDYEQTKDSPELHSKIGAEILKELGVKEEICQAVLTHNKAHGIKPESIMAKALYCVDPLTGLVVAATLVLPSKKINELTVDSVLNRFKEKRFAIGANRNIIKQSKGYLDIELKEFVQIVLKAMQKISDDLEL